MPASLMAEYDGTPAHDILNYLDENNHRQQGDPRKAAAFLRDLVNREKMPVHITIGRACCDHARENYEKTLTEIDSYYQASCGTDFDE